MPIIDPSKIIDFMIPIWVVIWCALVTVLALIFLVWNTRTLIEMIWRKKGDRDGK